MDRIQPKVLVVDDDKVQADLWSDILREEGYVVITAYSVADALQKAREHNPHAASTDVDLRDRICGIELMRELQKIVPGIAVCVMSGDMHKQRAQEATASGAYAALSKPVTLDHYVQTMAQGIDLSTVSLN